MKLPRIIPFNSPVTEVIVESCRTALVGGALVVIPTDTVYGLVADARNREAEKRLFLAKRRLGGKPVALLVCNCAQIEQWGVSLGTAERKLAQRFWPGPLTMVLPVGNTALRTTGPASARVSGGRQIFEGFRVPDHPEALDLLRALGFPLRATSANLAGKPPALTAESAAKELGRLVELVLDGGPAPGGVPSTVVKVVDGTYSVLREAAIKEAELSRFCDEIGLKRV